MRKVLSVRAFKIFKALAVLSLGLLVGGVAVNQLSDLAHACEIAWDGPNNPSLQADSQRNFGTSSGSQELCTSYVHYSGEPTDWDLYVDYTLGGSSNIASCNVNPDTFIDVYTHAYWSDMWGQLTSNSTNGTVMISAYATNANCVDTHYRTIIHG